MGSTAQVEEPTEMTSAEFDALLVRLFPLSRVEMEQGTSRVTMALEVAALLFIRGAPETDDTRTLRAHMKYLSRKGYFAFTDFRTEVGG